jgi:regulator of protease activity HflC (stomatin/prohibitin superfamily)
MITLLIFAAFLFAVARSLQAQVATFPQARRYVMPLQVASVLIAFFALLTAGVKQIDAGRVGVVSVFGKVEKQVLPSGLHFVNPLAEVTVFDATTQNYTMSQVHDEGQKEGDDAIRVLSADGLEVVIDLTVLYRIDPSQAPRIYQEVGPNYTDKLVRPIARTRIRDNAVYYDAVSLYSKQRDEFQLKIQKTIEQDFSKRGIILEQLLVRNILLPASVRKTIEEKINAEQESQKMQFVLAKERQEADRKRVEAQGIADYQQILQQSLSDKQLRYEMIKAQKEIALSPNAKVIIMDGKSGPQLILDTK